MKRRLALFFDGTWNRRSTETNVWRLYEHTVSQRQFKKLLGRMHDSFRSFAFGVYTKLPWVYPYNRPRELGVNENLDDSIVRRMESPLGKDERGKKYSPLAMK